MGFQLNRNNTRHMSFAIALCLLMSLPFIATQALAQTDAAAKVQVAEEEARAAQKNAEAKVRAAEEARLAEAKAAATARTAELEARKAQSMAAAKAKVLEKARMAQIIAERNSPAIDKARTDEEAVAAKVQAAQAAQIEQAKAGAKAQAAETAKLAQDKAAAMKTTEAAALAKAQEAEVVKLAQEKTAAMKATEAAALAKAQAADAAKVAEEKAAAMKAAAAAALAKAQAADAAKVAEEKAAAMKAAAAAALAKAQAADAAKVAQEKAAATKAAAAAALAKAQAADAAKVAQEKAAATKAAAAAALAKAQEAEAAKMAAEKAVAKKSGAAKSVAKAPAAKAVAVPKKAAPRDLANIIGLKECGECHKAEVFTWKNTHHSTTFNLLPRKKNTKAISGKMKIRSVKRGSACLTCHFTSKIIDGKEKAISGISCESCHGPAKKWIKIHGDYGGKKVTKEMETPEHKADRFAKIEAANMIRPNDLYRVAENCYQCHTVPNEKLVNVGGHKAGSDFELVSWSQGEVRHNFLNSSDKDNRQASPERKRLMFIVGRALHLEYSLRGVSKSTQKAKYAVTMAKRVVKIKKDLTAIQKIVNIPEITNMLSIANSVKLKLNNEAALVVAADKVAQEARNLAKTYTGKEWPGLDKYIPKKFKGKAGVAPPPGQ